MPKAAAIISDPPYGMGYTGVAGTAQKGMDISQIRKVKPIAGDDKPFDPMAAVSIVECEEVFLWGGDWFYDKLPAGGTWIVWDKRASEAADAIPGSPFEVCWSKERHARQMIRKPWGGWNNKEIGDTERHHPTQKPIECMERLAVDYTKADALIYDPFLGSGTTLIAAEKTGRKCYGLEIDPAYCDVIVARWEAFTGKKATLSGYDGTFEDLQQEREHATASA